MSVIRQVKKERLKKYRIGVIILVLMLSIAIVLMLMLGNTIYPVTDVLQSVLGNTDAQSHFAIQSIRLPRMLAGLLTGFSFGVAGYVFQTMLKNPLANPNVLGITTGSSAGAVFCIVLLQSSRAEISLASIVAGLATTLLIYLLAGRKNFSNSKLILIGIGMQAMLGSFISYLLLISSENNVPSALRWLNGSLNGIQMKELTGLFIALCIGIPFLIIASKKLAILELGDELAVSLGVKVNQTRLLLMLTSVLLVALATALTGPIAFVSFLAGPITKRIVGTGASPLLPSGLFGAILVLFADILGQFAFQTRVPVGIVTGLIGAPYLIYLLIRMSKRGEF
ncbi:MAG: FecCD family ABC transporter permease [Anaerorhabdus sp.]